MRVAEPSPHANGNNYAYFANAFQKQFVKGQEQNAAPSACLVVMSV